MMSRRSALVAGIVVVLVLMGVVTTDDGESTRTTTGARLVADVADPGAWYCAEGTSTPDGRADETIIIGNADATPSRATVTVYPGGDAPRVTKRYRVAPGQVSRIRVADIAVAAEPGVVVEVRGGRAGVVHEIRRGQDVALGPCAREPLARWSFAGGTTGKGAELWAALFNPFPDDAIVDVRAISGDGLRSPGALQGIVVPGYSRVSVPVHAGLPRVDLVALQVAARRGRIVAEQSMSLDGSDGRAGIAMTEGAAPATQWRFPTGVIGSGRGERLVIANPTGRQARVAVRFGLDAAAIEPQDLIVPGETALAVDLSRVPPDVGYSMTLVADRPIVAENVGSAAAPQGAQVRGIAAGLGLGVGAREWFVVPSRLAAASTDQVAILATDGRARAVRILTIDRNGARVVSRTRVPRRARLVVDLAAAVPEGDRTVLVRSDGPIVVERESAGPGITRSRALRG